MNLLSNPSFERGWTNLLPWNGTTNQQPLGYSLYIRLPGSSLLSADSYTGPDDAPVYNTVVVVPECVHKLRAQMPDADKLILAGDIVYKLFSATNPFSVDLSPAVVIPADGTLTIRKHVQVHNHGDGSPGAAVWRMAVTDGVWEYVEAWRTFGDGFNDREWATVEFTTDVKAGQVISSVITMESRALGGIDFFTDAWSFAFTPDEATVFVPCRGGPRWQYARVVNVVPKNATRERFVEIAKRAWDRGRQTITGSYDDAGIGDLDDRIAWLWDIPNERRAEFISWYMQHYPGVWLGFEGIGDTSPSIPPPIAPPIAPPSIPPSIWKPKSFVPYGTKLGWHAIGNCGLANKPNTKGGIDYGIYGADMIAPTIKLVVAIKDIKYMPCSYPMVRLIDRTPSGESIDFQGFNYDGNPEAQAEARVHDLVRALSPYAGQFRWTELCNEQDIPDIERAEMIARYSIRAMEVAPAWLGIGHFSFGTGNPPLDFWKPIADTGVFDKIAARGDALAFHSYHDHRNMADMVWHLTRYRFLYNQHILPRRLDIPMVLTECGPWRHLFNDPTFDLKEWIQVTDQWLSVDPYAMAQIYTVSDVGGEKEYNTPLKALYPWFIDWARSIAGRANA